MWTVHSICSLLGYGAFLVAFVAGVLFLIQDAQLKHKRMGVLFHRLPSLESLDRANFVAIGIGSSLLTVGLVFGLRHSHPLLGTTWAGDAVAILAGLLWVAYLGLWWVRMRATYRGRKIAILSVVGFLFAVGVFLGVVRWLPMWHAHL